MLQIGLDSAGNTLPWTHPLVLSALPLALVSFVLFVTWDLYHAIEPVIPIRLLKQRNIALSCIVYFFTFASCYSNIYFLPIYLQTLGLSTTQSGLRFLTQAFGAAVSTFVAGLIVKWTGRYYNLNLAAQISIVTGTGLLLILRLNTGAWAPFLFLALLGAGFGASWVTTNMALLSAITSEQQAILQSATYFVRCLGMIVGFAMTSAGFQKDLKDKLAKGLDNEKDTVEIIARVRINFDDWQSLSPPVRYIVQERLISRLLISTNYEVVTYSMAPNTIELPYNTYIWTCFETISKPSFICTIHTQFESKYSVNGISL